MYIIYCLVRYITVYNCITIITNKSEVWDKTYMNATMSQIVWSFYSPENFVVIRWQDHSERGVTDRQTDWQTDRQTERGVPRAAWSHLKLYRGVNNSQKMLMCCKKHNFILHVIFLNKFPYVNKDITMLYEIIHFVRRLHCANAIMHA